MIEPIESRLEGGGPPPPTTAASLMRTLLPLQHQGVAPASARRPTRQQFPRRAYGSVGILPAVNRTQLRAGRPRSRQR